MRTFVFDSQKLTAFESCGELYRLSYVEHWRTLTKPDYIDQGSLMHAMLAYYYAAKKAGQTLKATDHRLVVADCEEIALREAVMMDINHTTVAQDIFQFKEYIIHYQYDGWEPLYIEQPFSKVLYRREDEAEWRIGSIIVPPGTKDAEKIVKKEGLQIIVDGIVDLITKTPYGIALVDHKTYGRKYAVSPLNNQFELYAWAFGINNVVINRIGFQKSLKAEERFNRPWMRYQKANIKEWEQTALKWAFKIIEAYDKNEWLMNHSSCDKFNGCFFRGVCSQSPNQRQYTLMAQFQKGEPWSPYSRDAHLGVEADD